MRMLRFERLLTITAPSGASQLDIDLRVVSMAVLDRSIAYTKALPARLSMSGGRNWIKLKRLSMYSVMCGAGKNALCEKCSRFVRHF